jgi:hypothetical protein
MATEPPPASEVFDRGGGFSENVGWTRSHLVVVIVAIFVGALLGTFQIANTSVGWHLASGRLIVEQHSFLRADPFTFTSGGAPWIDHEWLFQVVAAVAHSIGGARLLVVLRAVTIGILAMLLLVVGSRSGLSPPVALLLSVLCVCGARPRFFLRPELVTLLVVPAAVWLFLQRERWKTPAWMAALAALTVVGANAHGGVLVLPIFLAGMLAAETLQMALSRSWNLRALKRGAAGCFVVVLALLVNPYGWHLFRVPFHLAHLVGQPHIPNPEWISPSFAQAPFLYLGILGAALILAVKERRAPYWVLLALVSALALRHVRTLGLFFVLLPLVIAPALAGWRVFAASATFGKHATLRLQYVVVVISVALAVVVAAGPWPRFGLGVADGYYPVGAADFVDREEIPKDRLYNDVRFGGYLIDRFFPPGQVFQDDRNEINEPLLREIWAIFEGSDVTAWNQLMSRFDVSAAMVRYHQPLRVVTPGGESLGERGFSALWFPNRDWALVYWDDVAMVLVRRESELQALVDRAEYVVIRPDDLDQLQRRLLAEPDLRSAALTEVKRALHENPGSLRASAISAIIKTSTPSNPTGR